MAHAMLVGAGVGAVSSMARGDSPFKGALIGGALGGAGSALSGGLSAAGGLGEAVGTSAVSMGPGADALLAEQLTQSTVNNALMSPADFAALPLDTTSAALPSMAINPVEMGGMQANFAEYAKPMTKGFDITSSPLNDFAKTGIEFLDKNTEDMGLESVVASEGLDAYKDSMEPQEIAPILPLDVKQSSIVPEPPGFLNVLGPNEAETVAGISDPSLLNNQLYEDIDERLIRQKYFT